MVYQVRAISASTLFALLSQVAIAQEPVNAPDSSLPSLSPGTISLINLGQAGLLKPFFLMKNSDLHSLEWAQAVLPMVQMIPIHN